MLVFFSSIIIVLLAALPQIVISPGNTTVEVGRTVILSCAGFGNPIPMLRFGTFSHYCALMVPHANTAEECINEASAYSFAQLKL